MALKQLFYVVCDDCGVQAGGDDNMGEDPVSALARAEQAGFSRKLRGNRLVDQCDSCQRGLR